MSEDPKWIGSFRGILLGALIGTSISFGAAIKDLKARIEVLEKNQKAEKQNGQ